MPNYRRYYIPNSFVFITCVTHQLIHYLGDSKNLIIFWRTLRNVKQLHPFSLLAYVILPDHFHWIMKLPDENENFSKVMQSMKWNYVRNFKSAYQITKSIKIWQERFWDHIIRSEQDLECHMDYIHWNPVKHGYVNNPEMWTESSMKYWIGKGLYEAGWGALGEPATISTMHLD